MRLCSLLVIVLLSLQSGASAQAKIDTASIIKALTLVRDRDQKTRTGRDSAHYMALIDSSNQAMVTALIDKYGWPGKAFVGAMGNNTVFLVIQHADLATQEKYLPLMMQSVADSQSRLCDLALLQDRVLMRRGKKQIYGSQVVPDKNTGAMMIYPIEDEAHVNERRAKAGLEPIEQYARYFGISYRKP
jgi:hypothetical protein